MRKRLVLAVGLLATGCGTSTIDAAPVPPVTSTVSSVVRVVTGGSATAPPPGRPFDLYAHCGTIYYGVRTVVR
ncbi:hypothetical protein V5P93_006536 [Actinokineospora auranticolor]|uniref:Lipoprotein n=1 Tax=Actinokineospora auranticolor TaxID=155976 RepID=A0A2S6GX90_9PSEU|nr:hypothetical protein [Actinokineospora auranticolor]PPK69823.1 hypothetical protein CLV40_103433 [Actinokineospora auranticolor]